MTIYMAVTTDKFELPVHVFDRVKDLAACYGMTRQNLNSYISRGIARKRDGVKFIRVEIEQ